MLLDLTKSLPNDAVYDGLASPVGRLTLVVSSSGVHVLTWPGADSRDELANVLPRAPEHPLVALVRTQLGEYFARTRRVFELPLAPVGTPFQLRAWRELSKIPYGETISYEEQARRLGDPRKCRAVGTANGRNPIAIVVPCHRVVAKSGALAGFGGGLPNKRYLLTLESEAAMAIIPRSQSVQRIASTSPA